MRHRVKGRKLNRSVKHRKALFKNLVTALIEHGEIKTSEAKAKAVKSLFDRLMTKAKSGTVHARRVIGGFLQRRAVANKLVDSLAPKTGSRTSGFTRIVRLGKRKGDDTMMVRMELVDMKKESGQKKVEGKKEVKGKSVKKNKGKTSLLPKPPEAKQLKSQTRAGRKVDASTQLRGER